MPESDDAHLVGIHGNFKIRRTELLNQLLFLDETGVGGRPVLRHTLYHPHLMERTMFGAQIIPASRLDTQPGKTLAGFFKLTQEREGVAKTKFRLLMLDVS